MRIAQILFDSNALKLKIEFRNRFDSYRQHQQQPQKLRSHNKQENIKPDRNITIFVYKLFKSQKKNSRKMYGAFVFVRFVCL